MNNPMQRATSLHGMRVLVTGATGRLGRHLVAALLEAGCLVSVLTRSARAVQGAWPGKTIETRVGDLTNPGSLAGALDGVRGLFHLASHSPPPGEPDVYEAPAHWRVSAQGTEHLLAAAIAAGVQRVVYLSSVKSMGDAAGASARPADESTPARPDTLYGRAKLAAERAVLAAGSAGRMHASVLRLPMVYGLGGQGNLARMIDAIARRRFPPWPRVNNRRSAIHVDDVVAAALLVATDRRAAGECYLVTDGAEYSTRWLYEQIHVALGRPIPDWSLPLWGWRGAARLGTLGERLTGRAMPLTSDALRKLAGDAWYSSQKIRDELSYVSSHRLETEIPRLVSAYLGSGAAGGLSEMGSS